MKVKTATFNGISFDLDMCGPIDGSCDYPHGGRPSIRVITKPKTFMELESLIHESLHAEDWRKSEKAVTRSAHEIARPLWRMGYRRTGK